MITDKDIDIEKMQQEISRLELENSVIRSEKDKYLYELVETRNSRTYKLAKRMSDAVNKVRGKKVYSRVYESQISYNYMISVVIPVYNTKEYISELLDSLLCQKLDVLARYLSTNKESKYRSSIYQNIYEVIIVDDGSTDGSDVICDEYANKYPWIKVVHKKNEGVSVARNTGVQYASGKYITFPDSDDKLSETVLQDCFIFFEEHENEIALVTIPSRFFDAQQGNHWTCYRFDNGSRIIDLQNEWSNPQYFISPCFVKLADIKDKIYFDNNLINGEDIKFVHELFFNTTAKIGVVDTCTYWYRRRGGEGKSAIQESKFTTDYYFVYIEKLLYWLRDESIRVYGYFPKYVQYAIMGQLQWRLRSDGNGKLAKDIIGEKGYELYRDAIKKLIDDIDLSVIMEQKQLFREHYFYLCNVKTHNNVHKVIENNDVKYYFEDYKCTDAATAYVKLQFINIKEEVLEIEADYANLEPGCIPYLVINDKKVYGVVNQDVDHNVYVLGEKALHVTNVTFKISLKEIDEKTEVTFWQSLGNADILKRTINLAKFVPLSKTFDCSYYEKEEWVVQFNTDKLIVWNIFNSNNLPDFEGDYRNQIMSSVFYSQPTMQEALSIRLEAKNRLIWKRQTGKQIWLISDRYKHADDNGEALFIYLSKQKLDNVKLFFVIDSSSKDFDRLSEIGNVVCQDSREHLVLQLIADCIISSQADEYIIDPFWRQGVVREIFRDFYNDRKFVFLQHGVIKDNLSKWLNKYNKNINGFVCSTVPEKESILSEPYYYGDSEVWLTGLPRFDRLYHDEKKYILVMPTWRKWLMKDFDAAISDKDAVAVIDNIEETEFFNYYYSLLNCKKLLDACDEKGYKLCFMPHVNLRECADKFCTDERVLLFDYDTRYRDAFAQANLLVTDYSSTPMDFAYLKKPVIYTQFDAAKFFSGSHTYEKGYFDYEKDGFGEIENDLDGLVDRIIEYINNDCKIRTKYKKRVEKFYNHCDQNNCKRVYDELQKLMFHA